MPVFGSMTSNTEFEFLTGDSMALLPANSIAYQFNVKPGTYSMVSTLKDQGYYSVAMHPYPGENWNRVECYQNMGFDAFLDQEFYEGSEELRNYVSDEADYQKLIQVVEAKENPEDKLFIFNVTMQNHGGYEGTYDNFEQEVWLTGEYEGKYPKTDQYLSLMKRSDQAFQYLVEYFSLTDQPTMIVMFGDHQPSVEQGFLDLAYGVTQEQMTMEQYMGKYYVPFVIWANYPLPGTGPETTSLNFLGQYLLRYAGIAGTPYGDFLWQLQEELPALTFVGYVDQTGRAYSHLETNDFTARIEDYQRLQYNNLFGGKDRLAAFFDPESGGATGG